MRKVDKKAFGQRVRQCREALGMNPKELAEKVGYPAYQTIQSIEYGEVARPRLMRELAAALRATEEWLLYRDGPAPLSLSGRISRSAQSHVSVVAKPPSTDASSIAQIDVGELIEGQNDAGQDSPVAEHLPFAWRLSGPFLGELSNKTEQLRIFPVEGDHMEDLLRDGDYVLVDLTRKGPIDAMFTFAVRGQEGSVLIRDVGMIDGRPNFIRCTVRNPNHNLALTTLNLPRENIIGRVVGRIGRL